MSARIASSFAVRVLPMLGALGSGDATARGARRLLTTLALALGVSATVAAPRAAQAQFFFTQLSVNGFPLTNTGPLVPDFEAGSVALGSTTFTVNLITNFFSSFSPRVTSVAVRCNTPCPASGVAPVASLQWRRVDVNPEQWNSLTTTFVNIETRTATFNGTNDPWTNTLAWRYLLSYTGSPPTAATQFNVQFQLTVTAP